MALWPRKPNDGSTTTGTGGKNGGAPEAAAASSAGSVSAGMNSLNFSRTSQATKPSTQETAPTPLPADPTAPAELSETRKKQQGRAVSQSIMAAFGQITSVLMRAQQYKHHALSDLEWLVVPAVMTGQYSLAEAQSKANGLTAPVGVLLWASVSAEVDKRLSENLDAPLRLKPEEWKSGDILWIIDAVGEPKMIQAMLKRMAAKDWAGRTIKMKARDKDGKVRIGVLSAGAAA